MKDAKQFSNQYPNNTSFTPLDWVNVKWSNDELAYHVKENPEVIRQFKILQPVDLKAATELARDDYSRLNIPDLNGKMPLIPKFFSFGKHNSAELNQNKKVAILDIATLEEILIPIF